MKKEESAGSCDGRSRTFGIASDFRSLAELKRREVAVLSEGSITGLNGVALAAAAEAGRPAVGLLGEMPAMAPQLPCPSASAAVLRVFKAVGDRSRAFELKKELDRLGVFGRYEDRFLDLFEA